MAALSSSWRSLASRSLRPGSAAGPLFVLDGDAVPLAQLLDDLRERQVLHPLHEADDVSALAAPVAVVEALLGAHRERRGLLLVEGAEARIGDAPLAQARVAGDDVDDVGRLEDGLHAAVSDEGAHRRRCSCGGPRSRLEQLAIAADGVPVGHPRDVVGHRVHELQVGGLPGRRRPLGRRAVPRSAAGAARGCRPRGSCPISSGCSRKYCIKLVMT